MMVLTSGQTDTDIIVTLNEKRTLDAGYYLFVWTHVTTKSVVTKIFSFADDLSDYQDRYNKFNLNPSVLFANKNTGEWVYVVYEQASSSNTNVTGLTEVERGLMKLNPAAGFEYEKYSPATTIKAYGG